MEITFWLSLFCIYETGFCTTYNEYINNPDDSVDILDDCSKYVEENCNDL